VTQLGSQPKISFRLGLPRAIFNKALDGRQPAIASSGLDKAYQRATIPEISGEIWPFWKWVKHKSGIMTNPSFRVLPEKRNVSL